MPRRPGGISSSSDYKTARFYLRTETKKTVDHLAIEEGRTGSSIVQEALDYTLYQAPVRLPIVGRVAGGSGLLAEENIEDRIALPGEIAGGASFAVNVKGDSMAPTILEGDLVLVRAQTEAANNQIVIAVFENDGGREGSVKRLRFAAPGCAELRSDNEEYETIPTGFSIIGIVVALILRFR